MSWFDDFRIRRAISDLPAGSGQAPRLICCPSHPTVGATDAIIKWRNFGVVVPNCVSNCADTTSTFENDSVFQIFMYAPPATGITLSDMTYIGTYSVFSFTYQTNPPFIYLHWHELYYSTMAAYSGTAGTLYFVTKHGWNINGVSYPSEIFTVRWTG